MELSYSMFLKGSVKLVYLSAILKKCSPEYKCYPSENELKSFYKYGGVEATYQFFYCGFGGILSGFL